MGLSVLHKKKDTFPPPPFFFFPFPWRVFATKNTHQKNYLKSSHVPSIWILGITHSVEFSSRWCIYMLWKTHMCSTPFFRSFPSVAFQTVSVFASLMMTIVVLKQSIKHRLFLSPFPPGIQWCDVLSFVPAGLQVFQDFTSPALTNLGCWEVREVNTNSMMGGNFPAWVQLLYLHLPILGWLQAVLLWRSGSWHFHCASSDTILEVGKLRV